MNAFLIMDFQSKIQKFFTATTKKWCWIVPLARLVYSGAFNTEFSKTYFFLPSITDRSKDINRHMGSVNLIPIDISEDSFEEEGEIAFDPSKLDYDNPDREKMRQDVMKVL